MRTFTFGLLVSSMLVASPAAPASAAYDLSGAWSVTSTPAGISTHMAVTQSSGALTYSVEGGASQNGTIDEGTGAFVLDVYSQYPACGTNSLTGNVAADSRSFTATYIIHTLQVLSRFDIRCVTGTYTLEGSRCGNGALDAGEDCDDNNRLGGDCCSSTCTLDAAGTACTDDYDVCTDDVCDGAGTCTHPDNTAPCTDAQGCGSGACAGGSCVITAPEPAGTSCDRDGSVCTLDECDGTGSCAAGASVDCAPCGTCDAGAGCVMDSSSCSTERAELTLRLGGRHSRVSAAMLVGAPAADLGDPTVDTAYTLCVGTGQAYAARTILSATVDAGGNCDGKPCWTQSTDRFFYKNAKSSLNGITQGKVDLMGLSAFHQVSLKGKGELLDLPDVFTNAFQTLTMKIIADDGVSSHCWVNTIQDDDPGYTKFKGSAFVP